MAYDDPTGIDKILVEQYGYEWVDGKAWAAGTAPILELPIEEPEITPTVPVTPDPAPQNPAYDTRFDDVDDAIAYAEENGQGELNVADDGSITNRFGETMVYDSSGNLAPAPRDVPVMEEPTPEPLPITNIPSPTGIDKILVEQYGYEWVDGKAWAAGTAPILELPIEEPEITPTVPVTPDPAPQNPAYDTRFDDVDDAIAYAEENGQGELNVADDGSITNRFGETMVYDSSGNLAPAPRDVPVMEEPTPEPLPITNIPSPTGIDKILVEQYGYEWVDGKAWAAGTAPILELPIEEPEITPTVPVTPDPAPQNPAYDTRFDDVDDAIAYAEENGQGELNVADDGSITNRFGETMVYDSSGNLAPAPRDVPVMEEPTPEPLPITNIPSPTGIDKILVEQYGYEWVDGKAWAAGTAPILELPIEEPEITPTVPVTPDPAPQNPAYDTRFDDVDDAIAYAEENGQGELNVADDGSITNRFGETMVYDSSGNLAPAPRDVPVMEEPTPEPLPITNIPSPTGIDKILVEQYGYEWVDGKAWAAGTAPILELPIEEPEITPTVPVTPDPAPQNPAYDTRFDDVDDAIAYAEENGQGELNVADDGSITNRFGETMVYDSSGNLAPAPRDVPVMEEPTPEPLPITNIPSPTGIDKILVEQYGYEWVDGKAWAAGTAPILELPIEEPEITPTVPVTPDPAPQNPAYDTRFDDVDDAIAYAEENGQGELNVADDGSITNRFGETMVYDSSGNLAPAPRDVPVMEEPTPEPLPITNIPSPTGIDKILVEQYGYEWVDGKAWAAGTAPILELPIEEPEITPTVPVTPDPAPQNPAYDTRFDDVDDAIAYAEENGQGELNVADDGSITNRFGETMVYDSSGNLAPAPRDVPVMEEPDPVAAQAEAEAAATENSTYGSRFDDVNNAIAYAEENGQGELNVADDGSITNRFGETMVYDSSGNLAPAPRDVPVMEEPDPVAAQAEAEAAATENSTYGSRFDDVNNAIAYAEENGQGELNVADDGSITNRFGETMVYDSSGNLAPAPRDVPVMEEPDPAAAQAEAEAAAAQAEAEAAATENSTYGSRFDDVNNAISYAEENGQGELNVADDGSITNRFGETMVYDSSGNLAPAPRDVPVMEEPDPVAAQAAAAAAAAQAEAEAAAAQAEAEAAAAQAEAEAAAAAAQAEAEAAATENSTYGSRFDDVNNAISYATENGQGELNVADDGSITNRFGETMVYDSSGNLAPAPRDVPVMEEPDPVAAQAAAAAAQAEAEAAAAQAEAEAAAAQAEAEAAAAQAEAEAAATENSTYGSRFDDVNNAISYATENGQGELNVADDGSITNRFGETMVYDSSGNLAPAPRDVPVMDYLPNDPLVDPGII